MSDKKYTFGEIYLDKSYGDRTYWKIAILSRDINLLNELARKISYLINPRVILTTDPDEVFEEGLKDLNNIGAKPLSDLLKNKKEELIKKIFELANENQNKEK